MEGANQDKFILVQSRITTGFHGSDASHKVCHLHSQFQTQNGSDRRPSFSYHLTDGHLKLKPTDTNSGHNSERQGTGIPTSWRVTTGILFLSEVPTNNL